MTGYEEGYLIPLAAATVRERWVAIPAVSDHSLWSPDSRHLLLRNGQVLDLTGKEVLRAGQHWQGGWRQDGRAVVVNAPGGGELWHLDGRNEVLTLPEGATPLGFLPDGRVLAYRLVFPRD